MANTVGIIAAADEALQRAEHDHLAAATVADGAQRREQREAERADDVNSTRVDSSRDSQPDSGIMTISATR